MSRLETRKKLASVIPLVVEGYENGATLRELAGLYEVAPGTIRNLLLAQGKNLRSRGRKRAVKTVATEEQTDGNLEQTV
jgi:hypothetical protein